MMLRHPISTSFPYTTLFRSSYLSVIELGTYELAGHAEARLAARGVRPDAAQLEEEMRQLAAPRLFPKIPPRRYLSFYPMSKRRGEQVKIGRASCRERV